MISTKNAQARLALGREQLDRPEVGELAHLDHRAQPVEVVGQRARLQLLALVGLLGLARERRLEHLLGALGRDHGHAVGVEHDEVARPDLARRRRPPARRARRRRPWSRRASGSSAPTRAGPSPPAPRCRARRASTSTAAAPRTCAWVASRSPSSATGAGSGIASTSTSPGCSARHHGVDHQVVVLPAARDPRRPARPRAGHELPELGVDQALAARGLVDGRRAEAGELGGHVTAPPPPAADAHERLAVAHVLVARTRAARGCRAARRAGRSRSAGTAGPASRPSPRPSLPHRGDVDVHGRREVAQLRLVGLEQEQLRRPDRRERARARPRPRPSPRARSTAA